MTFAKTLFIDINGWVYMIFKALAILVGILIFGVPWGRMGLLIAIPVEIGLFMLAYKLWEIGKK